MDRQEVEAEWVGSSLSSAKQLYLELYILNDSEGTHLKGVIGRLGFCCFGEKKRKDLNHETLR